MISCRSFVSGNYRPDWLSKRSLIWQVEWINKRAFKIFLEVFLFAFLPPIRHVRNEKRTGTRRSAIGLISYPDLPRVQQSEIWVRDYYWASFSLSLLTVPEVIAEEKKRLVPVSFWFLKWQISTFVLGNTLTLK